MELPKDQPDQPVQPANAGSVLNIASAPVPPKSGRKVYLLLAIFLVVVMIGGGIFLFMKGSGGENGSESSIPSLKKASGGLQGKISEQELFLKIKPKRLDDMKKEIEASTDSDKKTGGTEFLTNREKDPKYKNNNIAEFTFNQDNKGLYLFFPNKDMSFKEIRDSIVSVDNKDEIQVMFAGWNPELDSGKGQWMATEQNYYDKANIKELESEAALDTSVVKKGQGVVIMAPANIMIPSGHDSTFFADVGLFDWRKVTKGWVLLSAYGDTLGDTFEDTCLNRVSTVFVQDNAKTANMADAFMQVDLTDKEKFKTTKLDKGFYAVWVYVNDQVCNGGVKTLGGIQVKSGGENNAGGIKAGGKEDNGGIKVGGKEDDGSGSSDETSVMIDLNPKNVQIGVQAYPDYVILTWDKHPDAANYKVYYAKDVDADADAAADEKYTEVSTSTKVRPYASEPSYDEVTDYQWSDIIDSQSETFYVKIYNLDPGSYQFRVFGVDANDSIPNLISAAVVNSGGLAAQPADLNPTDLTLSDQTYKYADVGYGYVTLHWTPGKDSENYKIYFAGNIDSAEFTELPLILSSVSIDQKISEALNVADMKIYAKVLADFSEAAIINLTGEPFKVKVVGVGADGTVGNLDSAPVLTINNLELEALPDNEVVAVDLRPWYDSVVLYWNGDSYRDGTEAADSSNSSYSVYMTEDNEIFTEVPFSMSDEGPRVIYNGHQVYDSSDSVRYNPDGYRSVVVMGLPKVGLKLELVGYKDDGDDATDDHKILGLVDIGSR